MTASWKPNRDARGRFTFGRKDADQITDLNDQSVRDKRLDDLMNNGYVPAVTIKSSLTPRTSSDRRDWWDKSFASAEYSHEEGEYPQMPDDNTPGMHGGQSLSGNRRTHRMAYHGEDVTLRMPSATAIKRFAKENNGGTLDVPVSAETENGIVQGWVRVTPGEGGAWSAKALGTNGDTEVNLSEGVRAILESRRPSMALAEAGSLIERRKKHEATEGAEIKPLPKSSWVKGAGYDDATQTLTVDLNGKPYSYKSDRAAFDRLMNSDSPGRDYNAHIKAVAERVGSTQCPKCSRFTSDATAHRCPVKEKDRDITSHENDAAKARAERVLGGAGRASKARPVSAVDHQRAAWRKAAQDGSLDKGSKHEWAGAGVKRGFTTEGEMAKQIDKFANTSDPNTLRVEGITASDSDAFLKAMPMKNRQYRHGDGPTNQNLLASVRRSEGALQAAGTVTPPSSPNEKVELNGVYVLDNNVTDQSQAAWKAASYGLNAQSFPKVIEQRTAPDGRNAWYMEW